MLKPKTPVTNCTNSSEVVSRVLSQSVLSIAQARLEISKITGRHPDKSSIIRWIRTGKLDGVRLGRNWYTSTEALTRYIVKQTEELKHV